MTELIERESTVGELSEMPLAESFREVRVEKPLAIWTDVGELDLLVLNLFSPRDGVFWSFGMYARFAASLRRYSGSYQRSGDLRRALEATLARTGVERRSMLAFVLLGGLTRRFGDAYMPEDLHCDYFRLAQRHLSLVLPAASRIDVASYFRAQLRSFGPSAIRSLNEDVVLVSTMDFRADDKYLLLASPLGAAARVPSCDVDAAEPVVHGWRLGEQLDWLYGFPGEISLALLEAPSASAVEHTLRLARLRSQVAAKVCPLVVIECLRSELETPGWAGLPEMRQEIADRFDRLLSSHPVIRSDPLAPDAQASAAQPASAIPR